MDYPYIPMTSYISPIPTGPHWIPMAWHRSVVLMSLKEGEDHLNGTISAVRKTDRLMSSPWKFKVVHTVDSRIHFNLCHMSLDNEVPMFASVIAVEAEFIWETSQLIGFFASKAIMCVAQDSGFRYYKNVGRKPCFLSGIHSQKGDETWIHPFSPSR